MTLYEFCPSCKFASPLGFQFCGRCGARLGGAPPLTSPSPSSVLPAAPPYMEAERRQLTVMFCDLVNSTVLADQLDPEDLREIVRAYQQTCVEVIDYYEGHTAQYLGDGLLVYFGFPQAHEDDARRAVSAALGICGAMERLNDRLQATYKRQLAVRLGIHTGMVVTGEMGAGHRHEQLALGQAPHVAARLQGLASPNTVLLSATTYRLVHSAIACESLGEHRLRGVAQPLVVYRALHPRPQQSRFQPVEHDHLSPFVGRDGELQQISECFTTSVRERRSRVVLLRGEAGIGKSRLAYTFIEQVAQQTSAVLRSFCSVYTQNSAFHPIIDLVHRRCGFRSDDSAEQKLTKLATVLASNALPHIEAFPLLALLLSLPLPDHYEVFDWSPQRQKQRTIELLLRLLRLSAGAGMPLIILVEDLHWVDPSSLEFLSYLIESNGQEAFFVLLTCRPSFVSPWSACPHVNEIDLNRLTNASATEIVHRISGKPLPPEVLLQVLEHAEGVPLFIEELTKTLLESGQLRAGEERYEVLNPLRALAIPATLQDSLTARIDRLSNAKTVLQLGAVLGREFTYEMLLWLWPLDEETLLQHLAQLQESGLLFLRDVFPNTTYVFKHALIQEATYQSLLKSTRQRHHQKIAHLLEERDPETAQTRPELLAYHYTEAALAEAAIVQWLKAGRLANQRSAHLEAISHLTKGIALLADLLDLIERDRHELDLHLALGAALITIRGYTDPVVEKTFARAQEICERGGEAPERFWALIGLHLYHQVRGNLGEAGRLSRLIQRLADASGQAALRAIALFLQGSQGFFLGDFRTSLAQLETAYTLAPPEDSTYRAITGCDLQVLALCFGALVLWHRGEPERAQARGEQAIALARKLHHPHTLTAALIFVGGELRFYLGQREGMRRDAQEIIRISEEQCFPHWLAEAQFFLVWAEQGCTATPATGAGQTAYAELHRTIDAHAGVAHPLFLGILGDLLIAAGQLDSAREVAQQAVAAADQTGVRFWSAELLRIGGEAAARSGLHSDAERAFLDALEVARQQGSVALGARALTSLCRLWQVHPRPQRARELLTRLAAAPQPDVSEWQGALAMLAELAQGGTPCACQAN
jgi:class 3 adenylate cyclase/tetratricopeptide (TPR) repeat protein